MIKLCVLAMTMTILFMVNCENQEAKRKREKKNELNCNLVRILFTSQLLAREAEKTPLTLETVRNYIFGGYLLQGICADYLNDKNNKSLFPF
jgi:hypothetical protein